MYREKEGERGGSTAMAETRLNDRVIVDVVTEKPILLQTIQKHPSLSHIRATAAVEAVLHFIENYSNSMDSLIFSGN